MREGWWWWNFRGQFIRGQGPVTTTASPSSSFPSPPFTIRLAWSVLGCIKASESCEAGSGPPEYLCEHDGPDRTKKGLFKLTLSSL